MFYGKVGIAVSSSLRSLRKNRVLLLKHAGGRKLSRFQTHPRSGLQESETLKIISAGAFSLFLMLGTLAFAQQNQQAAPPPTNQSSYPSETHKLSPQEKSDTPDANGQPVDLNTASKKDLAAARDR